MNANRCDDLAALRPLRSAISRRAVLSLAATGAAAFACRAIPTRAAERDDSPRFTFAFVSDNHLGRAGEKESANMRATVAEVNESPAEFTIFCGDLVDNGQQEENERRYPEWVEIASGLKRKFFAVPGNHDPDALFVKHAQTETDFIVEHKGYRFVCFRDAQPNPGHDGVVTPEQLGWIDRRMREGAAKGQRVVLVSHVIFHKNQHPDVGWYIKEGRDEFAKVLAANDSICAFFAGHFHCGVRGWDDTSKIHEIILPSTSWNARRGLEKAPGFALDEIRPGYVLVDVFDSKLVLTYKPIAQPVSVSKELALK
jgi:Icc-related predicted phosphoesterase